MFTSNGFDSLINIPTREEFLNGILTQSMLDHILFKQPRYRESFSGVVTCKISDHYLVLAAVELGIKNSFKTKENKEWIDIIDHKLLSLALQNSFQEISYNEQSGIEECLSNFVGNFNRSKSKATISVKRKHHKKSIKPWINNDILKLIKERDNLFKKWKNAGKVSKEFFRQSYVKIRK